MVARVFGGLGLLASIFRGGWKRLLWVGLIVGLLVLLLLWLSAGAALPDDGDPIEESTTAAVGFIEKITTAGGGAVGSRRVNLVVSDVELTSFLRIGSQLARQLEGEGPTSIEDLASQRDEIFDEIPGGDAIRDILAQRDRLSGVPDIDETDFKLRFEIRDPEVRFRADGSAVIRGSGKFLFLTVPARVVVAPRVEAGTLVFDFVEGQLGRVGLPESIVDRAGEALVSLILAGQNYAAITDIRITEGTLRLRARAAG